MTLAASTERFCIYIGTGFSEASTPCHPQLSTFPEFSCFLPIFPQPRPIQAFWKDHSQNGFAYCMDRKACILKGAIHFGIISPLHHHRTFFLPAPFCSNSSSRSSYTPHPCLLVALGAMPWGFLAVESSQYFHGTPFLRNDGKFWLVGLWKKCQQLDLCQLVILCSLIYLQCLPFQGKPRLIRNVGYILGMRTNQFTSQHSAWTLLDSTPPQKKNNVQRRHLS